MDHDILFTSIKIGNVEIKNRYTMASMGPLGLSDSEGGWNQRGIDYYTARAKGGIGLVCTGVTFSDCEVEQQSMPNCPNSTYNPVHFVRTSREMTERVHAYGSKIFLMMSGGFGRDHPHQPRRARRDHAPPTGLALVVVQDGLYVVALGVVDEAGVVAGVIVAGARRPCGSRACRARARSRPPCRRDRWRG